MELERIRCLNCGAEYDDYDLQADRLKCTRIGCGAEFLIPRAKQFAQEQIDHEKVITNLRRLLDSAVLDQDSTLMEKHALDILKLIQDDALASYCRALGQKKRGKLKVYAHHLSSAHDMTEWEADRILNIALKEQHFTMHDEESLKEFIHTNFTEENAPEREKRLSLAVHRLFEQQNRYANIPRDVFICHSSQDEIAQEVYQVLSDDGVRCWISERSLPPDTCNYWDRIEQAIRKSKIMLVIASRTSMVSPDPIREMELAEELGMERLELKVDDKAHTVYFKHFFDGIQWIQLGEDKEKAFDELKERVFTLLYRKDGKQKGDAPDPLKPVALAIEYLNSRTKQAFHTETRDLSPGKHSIYPNTAFVPNDYRLEGETEHQVEVSDGQARPASVSFSYHQPLSSAEITIRYLDRLTGKEVAREKRFLAAGHHEITADRSQLPSGYELLDKASLRVTVNGSTASPDTVSFTCKGRAKSVMVVISYQDKQGKQIAPNTYRMLAEGEHRIAAEASESLKDYTLASSGVQTVAVSEHGAKPNPVVFIYEARRATDPGHPSIWVKLGGVLVQFLIITWLLAHALCIVGLTGGLSALSRELPFLKDTYFFIENAYLNWGNVLDISGYGEPVTFLTLFGTMLILVVSLLFGMKFINKASATVSRWILLIIGAQSIVFWSYILPHRYSFRARILQDKLTFYFQFILQSMVALLLANLVYHASAWFTRRLKKRLPV